MTDATVKPTRQPKSTRGRDLQQVRYRDRIITALISILAVQSVALAIYPTFIRVHNSPDATRSFSHGVYDPPPKHEVYAFAKGLFQALNYWPNDANKDYERNLIRYQAYLTDRAERDIYTFIQANRKKDRLRLRSREIYPAFGEAFDPETSVKPLLEGNAWQVVIDFRVRDTIANECISERVVRYTLRIISYPLGKQENEWDLAYDSRTEKPQRIITPEKEASRCKEQPALTLR